MPGMEPFIWKQRFLSYSPTLAGLKKQVDGRFAHLLDTAEVHDLTPDEVRKEVKFAIYYVECPGDVFDPDGPTGGYTWQQGRSLRANTSYHGLGYTHIACQSTCEHSRYACKEPA